MKGGIWKVFLAMAVALARTGVANHERTPAQWALRGVGLLGYGRSRHHGHPHCLPSARETNIFPRMKS